MAALLPQLVALLTLLIPLTRSNSSTSSPLFLSVTDFGAIGDGLHYDISYIQSAIDACNHTPCHVTFQPGGYLTATTRLRSGVLLEIENNALRTGDGKVVCDTGGEGDRRAGIIMENVKGFDLKNVNMWWSDDHRRRRRNSPLVFRPRWHLIY